MLEFESDHIEYNLNQCQQCGICDAVCPKSAIKMLLRKDGTHEVCIDHNLCIKCGKCVKVCPANKKQSFENYFSSLPQKKFYLGYNKDNHIRRLSSSGGVCKTLIIESLRSGLVDGVYSLKKSNTYPYAEGEFYTKQNIPEYADIPNSVYHSVMLCQNARKIQKCNTLMVIGTSCQLQALDTYLKKYCNTLIKVCIFCKQQKTVESTRFLAKILGTKIPNNLAFTAEYRGNGWPGMVRINSKEIPYHRAAQLSFGRRLWTVPGCNVCGDPFGFSCNADITLMDPWKIRNHNDTGETLVIANTDQGNILLTQIDNVILEKKEYSSVKEALSLKDIVRKQNLVPFFRNETNNKKIILAGKAEILQQKYLQFMVNALPRMPILFYRILCKIPDLRNKILK